MALPTAGTVVAGQVYTAAAHNIIVGNVNQLGEGYTFVETAYFTSSGSFVKATYPYLRAIKVRLVGGGGGGCGVATNADGCGTGGGGGGYAERFYTDIASLDASVTVTVGAAGTGALPVTIVEVMVGYQSSVLVATPGILVLRADSGGFGSIRGIVVLVLVALALTVISL
jgi:hypothetical protein